MGFVDDFENVVIANDSKEEMSLDTSIVSTLWPWAGCADAPTKTKSSLPKWLFEWYHILYCKTVVKNFSHTYFR